MAKLLIVDDEDDVRDFASNFFRKRKIEVITAANGEEAVEIVEKEKPDLILLDILMTGINGIQALEAIRTFDKNVKVIMVTGAKPEDNEAFNRCRELGAYGYIRKPLKLDELEEIVMKTLREIN